ncbi:hypothetical protein HZS_2531, partial [Henneguya salminicola]
MKIYQAIWKKLSKLSIAEKFNCVCGTSLGSHNIAKILSSKNRILNIDIETEEISEPIQIRERNLPAPLKCLVIEEAIHTGNSIVTTVNKLKERNIKVQYSVCIVVCDKKEEYYRFANGIRLISLFKISDFISEARTAGKFSENFYYRLNKYFIYFSELPFRYTLKNRRGIINHLTSVRLIDIMLYKLTNLCVEFDEYFEGDLIEVVRKISRHVCAVKIDLTLVEKLESSKIEELLNVSKTYQFLLFFERNFTFKGLPVNLECNEENHKIFRFADMISVDTMRSRTFVKEFLANSTIDYLQCDSCIFINDSVEANNTNFNEKMSSNSYLKYNPFIVGFICQTRFDHSGEFLSCIRVEIYNDKKSGYKNICTTPLEAIRRGADIIIVGRQITAANDPLTEAKRYKDN